MRLLQNSALHYYTLRANDMGLVVAGIRLAQHILILVESVYNYVGNVRSMHLHLSSSFIQPWCGKVGLCRTVHVCFVSFTCFLKFEKEHLLTIILLMHLRYADFCLSLLFLVIVV